jgi:hypothetical protein
LDVPAHILASRNKALPFSVIISSEEEQAVNIIVTKAMSISKYVFIFILLEF